MLSFAQHDLFGRAAAHLLVVPGVVAVPRLAGPVVASINQVVLFADAAGPSSGRLAVRVFVFILDVFPEFPALPFFQELGLNLFVDKTVEYSYQHSLE